MPHENAGMTFVSNDFSPDVLADDAISYELISGTVRISFGVVKMVEPVPPSPVHMVHIGRLVIGVEGAQRLALGLFDYLKKQGLDPSHLVKGDQVAN